MSEAPAAPPETQPTPRRAGWPVRILRGLLADSGLKPVRVGHVVSHDGQIHEHHIKARGPMPLRVDDLSARLAQQGGLAGFSVMPRDD